jgi:hypothetical protein
MLSGGGGRDIVRNSRADVMSKQVTNVTF